MTGKLDAARQLSRRHIHYPNGSAAVADQDLLAAAVVSNIVGVASGVHAENRSQRSCVKCFERAVTAAGNEHLIQLGNKDDSLRFFQAADTANAFALRKVDRLKSVVLQSSNEKFLSFEVDGEVI